MKIVTYNVNGLRPRISQYGSLLKLLDSFDADIICFQETKLRRQELTADLVMAEGYESFFSCTRTCEKGRSGYSGVATFCRVKSAFSSTEVALPVAAEQGFTGLIGNSEPGREKTPEIAPGLEEFARDELLKVDSEGRCVITDHGHFVLFNLYGPRAESDDLERIEFKLKFFKILQKRWETLLSQGRRIFVVGDLNIAPTSLDRCEAAPDFENNEFRRWFRSMLLESGGPFYDVFRAKHPDRVGAYTCWPQNTGAEEFNYGTRIDHILCAGSCLHQEQDQQGHSFVACHVKECDILTEYKRWRPGNSLRWKGGQRIKLEGSDHAPVYTSLLQIPSIPPHSTPTSSARYIPMIYGIQQTLVSVLMRRQVAEQIKSSQVSSLSQDGDVTLRSCSEREKRPLDTCPLLDVPPSNICTPGFESEFLISRGDECSRISVDGDGCKTSSALRSDNIRRIPSNATKKKAKKSQGSQLSLKSFFQKSSTHCNFVDRDSDCSADRADLLETKPQTNEPPVTNDLSCSTQLCELKSSASSQEQDEPSTCSQEKNSVALLEWQRIQQVMQNSIPLCKGHREPCVARVVKKQGPNFGRRFYVCARAEGPASNPEANCNYFKWAASKSTDVIIDLIVESSYNSLTPMLSTILALPI
ncbi:DNA-(apurinic or apyrimidinic site) endonuclease 2 isoform X2 [Ziziphus jujuba]|uniref:DNA-(apurinic or apyrimidinic site) endonuclease 2 n=1 Tax=Ziziphus jujuba TaxID=326968 RepID=A0A6P4A3F8_ZIZJJ|nr:DNA-(apurinic or apyrimidinic site) endonuclease 2 isoform X2 [Ziziphus jujuba]